MMEIGSPLSYIIAATVLFIGVAFLIWQLDNPRPTTGRVSRKGRHKHGLKVLGVLGDNFKGRTMDGKDNDI